MLHNLTEYAEKFPNVHDALNKKYNFLYYVGTWLQQVRYR